MGKLLNHGITLWAWLRSSYKLPGPQRPKHQNNYVPITSILCSKKSRQHNGPENKFILLHASCNLFESACVVVDLVGIRCWGTPSLQLVALVVLYFVCCDLKGISQQFPLHPVRYLYGLSSNEQKLQASPGKDTCCHPQKILITETKVVQVCRRFL